MFGWGNKPASPQPSSPDGPICAGNGSGLDKDVKTVGLQELVRAIADALFASTEPLRNQHIQATTNFYHVADGDGGGDRALTPKTVSIHLPPKHAAGNGGDNPPTDVPLAALAQNNPIMLDEASLDLQCRLQNFDRAAAGDPIVLALAVQGGGIPVRLNLRYRQTDRPEGVARVDDALVHKI